MALIKKPVSFEQEPTMNTNENDTAVAERNEPEVTHAAVAAAEVAVVKAVSSSLSANEASVKAKAFQREFAEMKDASDFAYGSYRTFKASNGQIMENTGEKEVLGRWAKVRLIAWGETFQISPGEQAASTKDFLGFSKDGKTIDSIVGEEQRTWVGKPVAEYVNYLKEVEGFTQAKSRRFIDLGAALMACDTGDGPIGTVVQITLSESSISSFAKYEQELKDTARCVAMGLPGFKLSEDPFMFYAIREVTTAGSNTWTKIKLSATLPVKI